MNRTILLLSILIQIQSQQRYVKVFHGIYSNCTDYNFVFNNFPNIECIETGDYARSLGSIAKHARIGCITLKQQLSKQKEIFEQGIILVGLSMGGMVAQRIIQECT